MTDKIEEEKKELTFEEREEINRQKIKQLETLAIKDIPKVNYKWYENGTTIYIEIYEKNLQQDECTARLDEQDSSILFITVKGVEHKFDLFGAVSNVKVNIKKTKAEIQMNSASTPSHFPVLLKCEGKINELKAKKYAELDKIGEQDKSNNLNDFFQGIFSQGNDDQKKAMVKSMMESGGTVLSTNWQEVGEKKVEPKRGDK